MAGADGSTELDRRLAEVDALRRRVLNVIPHALRTPITTFHGLAEALVTASEREIREEITPALRRLASQAEHLLDDMLIAAGYSTALPTGNDVAAPIAPLVREVWGELASAEQAIVEVRGDEALAALAPPGSLHKMLVHVLDNAAKYGNEGEPAVVSLTRDGDRAVIVVDSPGPEVKELPMLLEPFFRGERAVMRSAGLGVGLPVARALAVQAGGDLTVEAMSAGGLRTTLELRAASGS